MRRRQATPSSIFIGAARVKDAETCVIIAMIVRLSRLRAQHIRSRQLQHRINDSRAEIGESLAGDSFDMGPGGKGSNQAIGAARLGADVRLLVCLGDDIFAENALELYRREGIGAELVHQIAGASSGIGFVNIVPSGENWITVDLGANLLMTPKHVRDCAAEISDSDILMTQLEIPPATAAAALRLGKASGALTILNPAPAQPIERAYLADVDILTPNASEARILLGLPPDDASPPHDLAQRLLDLGVGRVVVTLGAEGALIADGAEMTRVPAISIRAVDVTGAGDSFNAALAVSLGEGRVAGRSRPLCRSRGRVYGAAFGRYRWTADGARIWKTSGSSASDRRAAALFGDVYWRHLEINSTIQNGSPVCIGDAFVRQKRYDLLSTHDLRHG